WFPGKCSRGAMAGSPEASRHCSHLEYWNPDNLCCGSCLQRFGPPPCFLSDSIEFLENCGLSDAGDHVMHPFKDPPGQCNPDNAELCSPCGSRATAPTPTGSRGGSQRRCREVLVLWLSLGKGAAGWRWGGTGGVAWSWMGGVCIKRRPEVHEKRRGWGWGQSNIRR
uniref:IGF like family receptor 1 n=1 Tax=Sus scrofa TaxID=9823 RepID=A0A8D1FUN9_PIG